MQAVLVMLYHIASFSNCWQEAPETGVLHDGALVPTFWELLFGMREVIGFSVLGESSKGDRFGGHPKVRGRRS